MVSVAVLLSRSCRRGLAVAVLPSRSCRRGLAVAVFLSRSFCRGLAVAVLLSRSCRRGLAVAVLPSPSWDLFSWRRGPHENPKNPGGGGRGGAPRFHMLSSFAMARRILPSACSWS